MLVRSPAGLALPLAVAALIAFLWSPSLQAQQAKADSRLAAGAPPPDSLPWADAVFGNADPALTPDVKNGWWPTTRPPFSFIFDGKPFDATLPTWQRTAETSLDPGLMKSTTSWLDPQTQLKVTAKATVFRDFSAVEWVLHFENTGSHDTPILEKIQAIDVDLNAAPDQPVILDRINGDDCSSNSFLPIEHPLKPGEAVPFASAGGRPSTGAFPFFNTQYGQQGFITAIGWTGQWAAEIRRASDGTLHLQAGMELTHLRLHPGESIRTPRILILHWSGDRIDAHNSFRRLLLTHYQPKLNGRPIQLAVSAQSFNAWFSGTSKQKQWASEAGQLAAAQMNHDLGCNTLWFDAGWFADGNFGRSVGTWVPTKELPNGLRPIGDACQKLGLKFLVWYEPERVADNTDIAREHAEFVLPAQKPAGAGGLFNLGDPKACEWMTNLLIKQIADFNIHTYRNDFNMDPLPYWRQNDFPDRQGITEIRYVEGLYRMWDAMRAKYPQMYLDDCASGGRRIDLETLSRAVVQTRSDTACAAGRSEWDQCQTYGLSLYLPLHATIGWDVGAYECRSSATAGFCGEWDILDPSFPADQARASIAEINANRRYWYGEFYPLTPCTMANDVWIAWQLHRRDLDEGLVLAFRRKDCQQASLLATLRGLDPDRTYTVTFTNDQRETTTRSLTGHDFATLTIESPKPHSSVMIRYAPTVAKQ